MDLTVVIVNWNVRELLKQCLVSIYQYTQGLEFEVFVVDNNSNDASQEMLKNDFPWVKLIANDRNRGFSAANNQALKIAQGRYALLLNPDTRLIDNSFKALVDFMDRYPQINSVAPQLVFPDGSLQRSCRHFPSLFIDLIESMYLNEMFPKSGFFNRYKMGDWDHSCLRPVDQPFGACLLFRRQDLLRLDFMDESFFMYYDEVDLCYRLKKSGGSIYYLPQVKVIHAANQSSKQIPDACDEWKTRSRVRFFIKHYGKPVLIFLFLNLLLRAFLVYGILNITSFFFGRPRDKYYFQNAVKCLWRIYVAACQPSFYTQEVAV
jgi:GT2 family glycosyltransferase